MMTQLIEKGDPRFFQVTSEEPYDRHNYRVVSIQGDSVDVSSWEDAAIIWWNKKAFLSHIEVLDKPKPKSKGFA